MQEAKLKAPEAFRSGPYALERAITASDYAQLAERNPKLQSAAASLEWTGSWYEAAVAIDPLAKAMPWEPHLERRLEEALEVYRRAGHDLRVYAAQYVPVILGLTVCVDQDYIQGHVRAALLDAFSNRVLPGGKRGFFHPDQLIFGGDIYVSVIAATAQDIPGVASVRVTALHRQFAPRNSELKNGFLALGPFEIAQLDDDPEYPDHGQLKLKLIGGR